MLDTTITDQTQAFLDAFGNALEARDIEAAKGMFQETCYWRDLVTFSWNIKTVEGHAGVGDLLNHQLDAIKPSNWKLAEGETPTEEGGVVTAWITFETEVARGEGLVRLMDGKIWTLLTAMKELKWHEEKRGQARPQGVAHGSFSGRQTWQEQRQTEADELGYKTQPYTCLLYTSPSPRD